MQLPGGYDDFTDSSKPTKPLEIFSINNKTIYTLNKSLLFERKSKFLVAKMLCSEILRFSNLLLENKVRVNGLNLSKGMQNLFELARGSS